MVTKCFQSRKTKRVDVTVSAIILKQRLPEVLGIDEFKSLKSVDSNMSVNLCDIQTGDIIDIVPDRRKRYWKVLLKNDFNLNGVKFCKYVHYKKWTNTKEILIDLLSLSDRLSAGHSLYQEFLYTIHNRDIDCFEAFLDRYLNQDSIPPGRIHHRVVPDSQIFYNGFWKFIKSVSPFCRRFNFF